MDDQHSTPDLEPSRFSAVVLTYVCTHQQAERAASAEWDRRQRKAQNARNVGGQLPAVTYTQTFYLQFEF